LRRALRKSSVDRPEQLKRRGPARVVLHLSEHHGDACPGAKVRIEVDDIDAYCIELLAKKYRYSRPDVQNTEWKTRETTVRDPFGNQLTFWVSESTK